MSWIWLNQDTEKWRAFVKTIMNFVTGCLTPLKRTLLFTGLVVRLSINITAETSALESLMTCKYILSPYTHCSKRYSSVSAVTRLCLNFEHLCSDSWQGQQVYVFSKAPRLAVGPTQPHIQLVPAKLSLGIKRPRRRADICAEIKMNGAVFH